MREDGVAKLHLVFDNCMVRCALFRYGHPQKLSLCLMNHGLFCGLLEKIHGGTANLDILHAGENACLKVLTVEKCRRRRHGGKTRVSIEWLSGCSGCELGLVDLHEKLLAGARRDRARAHADPDGHQGLRRGRRRHRHRLGAHRARRPRRAGDARVCKSIVAFGTCPVYGGPHSSAYAHASDELLDGSSEEPDHGHPRRPDGRAEAPRRQSAARRRIEVDLYLPGCPPHSAFIFEALLSLVRGRAPTIGRHNVCFHCDRKMVKTETGELRRAFDGEFDPELCFLSQGCLCFGSVTLDRCQAPA